MQIKGRRCFDRLAFFQSKAASILLPTKPSLSLYIHRDGFLVHPGAHYESSSSDRFCYSFVRALYVSSEKQTSAHHLPFLLLLPGLLAHSNLPAPPTTDANESIEYQIDNKYYSAVVPIVIKELDEVDGGIEQGGGGDFPVLIWLLPEGEEPVSPCLLS